MTVESFSFVFLFLGTAIFMGCEKENRSSHETENLNLSEAEQTTRPSNDEHRISIVYSKNYLINLMGLERLHPFDIKKYKKIHDQLIKDGLLTQELTHRPDQLTDEQILKVQSQKFVDSLADKETVARYLEADILRRIPVSLQSGIVEPFRHASGGTILAARLALKNGIGINIGGGYHHAKVDEGEGFCLFADVPIAIRILQEEKKIKRALVIDVDAHQGNGTAECLAADESTFTFSMHQGDIYPIPKARSDLDIDLDEGTGDKEFNQILAKNLPELFETAKPDIVFIVGGCDTLKNDPLAGLMMTHNGIVERDNMIVNEAATRKIPVVLTLAGGYSKDAWKAQYLSIKSLIEKYGLAKSSK